MLIPPFYLVPLVALAVVGIVSWFIRCLERGHSSWPTWLLILTTLLLLLQSFWMFDPLINFKIEVFAMVFCRWMFALIRRERSYGWAFYLVVLIAAENLIYPVAHWYAYK